MISDKLHRHLNLDPTVLNDIHSRITRKIKDSVNHIDPTMYRYRVRVFAGIYPPVDSSIRITRNKVKSYDF